MNTNASSMKQSVEFNFTNSVFVNGTHMIAHRNDNIVVVVADSDYKAYFHNLIGRGIVNTIGVQEVVVADSHFWLAKEMYEETDSPSRIRKMADDNKVMPPKDHHVSRITLLRSTLNAIGETPSLKECKAMVDLFYAGHTEPKRCYYRVTIGEHAVGLTTQEKLGLKPTTLTEMFSKESAAHLASFGNITDDNQPPYYCDMPSLVAPQHLFAYMLDQIEYGCKYTDKVAFELSHEDIKLLAKQVKVFIEDPEAIGGGRKLKGCEKKAALCEMLNTEVGRREQACEKLNSVRSIAVGENSYKITTK